MRLGIPFLGRRNRRARIPILVYHSLHAPGTDYASNDHVALEEDLRLIKKLRFRVAPLAAIARFAWGQGAADLDDGQWVGLTFDDGTDYDYLDINLPDIGYIKSFYTILKESGNAAALDWPQPTGVSFVIASPDARRVLDRTCIAGRDNWRDTWWEEAAGTGILAIGNHSWDHTHPTLELVAQRNQLKGTFLGIDNLEDADTQIRKAEEYIQHRTRGRSAGLFAYPYGEASEYLVREYFPRFKERHRQFAAFTTAGEYALAEGGGWSIPRFMCGEHWKTPEELEKILLGAKSR
jgi:hypothetical protein